jgi:hypothetical protein
MNIFLSIMIAIFIACLDSTAVKAQITESYSRNVEVLLHEESPVIVVKREVIPGVVTFTWQNGCFLQNPVCTNFLDNGTVLSTPIRLTISGNTIPQWRNEYRKPWMSELTDLEGREYKIIFFQIGRHPSNLIRVEESDKKMVDAQTVCIVGAYKIFGSNFRLLTPIPNQKQNSLSVPFKAGWERHFSNY